MFTSSLLKTELTLVKSSMEFNARGILTVKSLIILGVIFLVSCSDSLLSDEAANNEVIYISTGETQCNDDGLSLQEISTYLTDADIKFTESQCAQLTGIVYPDVCGADTANITIFTIEASGLSQAENVGFASLSSLDSDIGYEILACE